MYSKEELERTVCYLACGCDFRPLFVFSSQLFIYVDWRDRRWSATPEQHLRRIAPAQSRRRGQQLERAQAAAGPHELFRPATREEIEERIRPPKAGGTMDFGFMGDLVCGLDELNRQLAPDHLNYKRDRHVPFGSVGAIGIDSIKKELPEFGLTPAEKRDCRATRAIQRPWAREITVGGRVRCKTRQVRLLYVAGEAIATYCRLYARQRIAPRVLITTATGMGQFAALEDPRGIMARLLAACEVKPRRWIRLDGDWEWSTDKGDWHPATRPRSEA